MVRLVVSAVAGMIKGVLMVNARFDCGAAACRPPWLQSPVLLRCRTP